jgi:hypothetical protein
MIAGTVKNDGRGPGRWLMRLLRQQHHDKIAGLQIISGLDLSGSKLAKNPHLGHPQTHDPVKGYSMLTCSTSSNPSAAGAKSFLPLLSQKKKRLSPSAQKEKLSLSHCAKEESFFT